MGGNIRRRAGNGRYLSLEMRHRKCHEAVSQKVSVPCRRDRCQMSPKNVTEITVTEAQFRNTVGVVHTSYFMARQCSCAPRGPRRPASESVTARNRLPNGPEVSPPPRDAFTAHLLARWSRARPSAVAVDGARGPFSIAVSTRTPSAFKLVESSEIRQKRHRAPVRWHCQVACQWGTERSPMLARR